MAILSGITILHGMSDRIIIDGNNLLHAMAADAPIPAVGRETLVKIIERWAGDRDEEIDLVFDGPVPRGGLLRQMSPERISVRFSGKLTADDLIVEQILAVRNPTSLRVVTSDGAIRKEANYRRCTSTPAVAFIAELFPPEERKPTDPPRSNEKPDETTIVETRQWLDAFGFDEDDGEPFDGHDAMQP